MRIYASNVILLGMLTTLRNSRFRRLLLSHVLALLGTGLATIALGFVAFDLAGDQSGSVLGTVLAIKMLCFMVVAPLAAAVLVRFQPRTVMVGSDVLRAAVAVCLPFVSDVWHIYALIVVLYIASAVFTPTFQATIPRVLPDDRDYGNALALSRLAYDVEALMSPVLTGILLLVIPTQYLFFGTALGFAASALLIGSLVLPKALPSESRDAPFMKRLTLGSRLLFATPALRGIFTLQLALAGSGSFVMVQTVAIVRGPLGADAAAVALALGAMGAGSICGALSSPGLVARLGTRRVLLFAGVLVSLPPFGVPLALSLNGTPGLAILAALWFVLGIGYSGVLTPVGQVIRATVPEPELPAVFAAQFSLAHGWWLLCYPLAGWLGALTSLGTAAVVLAGISFTAALAASFIWRDMTRRHVVGDDDRMTEDARP
ncbi:MULTISPECIES: MFS transporter [unclassified Arthrobacter]|uniref:MFS transporter n=1 Tax=unclassified Arthrobacter TaxID=235627 RepID=UPI002882EF22|nr:MULTISPECIES: MFS transporter [unclassified Arthrobacter]